MFTNFLNDWLNQLLEAYHQWFHGLTWIRNLLYLEWAKSTNIFVFSVGKKFVSTADKHNLSVCMCANCFIIFHLEKKKRQSISERIKVLLTLLAGVWFCCHLDIIGGQQPCYPVGFSFPPVGVGLVEDVDQLTLGETQLVLIGSHVVIHCNNLAYWGNRIDIWSLICCCRFVEWPNEGQCIKTELRKP